MSVAMTHAGALSLSRGFGRLFRSKIWVWSLLVYLAVAKPLQASDDWQYRVEGQITAALAKNVKMSIATQSRYNEDSFFYQHSDLSLIYTGLAPWLDLSVDYKVVFKKQADETWTYGTLPHLNATVRFPLFGLTLSDRFRLEYANAQDFRDYGTLRNKLSLNPPFYLDPIRENSRQRHHKVRPFASYELFYSTDSGEIFRHEFTGGLSMAFSKRVYGDLYYLRQENMVDPGVSDVSDGVNIVGLTLKLLF